MKKRSVPLVALALTWLTGLSCSTTIIEPDTQTGAAYRLGKLKAEEPHDIDTVYAATEKAMQELGLNITQKLKDQLEAKVTARDAQDKKIEIELVAAKKNTTAITINISPLEKARRIYQTIHDNLATGM